MSSRDFTRPIEHVSISKYSHGTTRERGVRLYCTASPDVHGEDNARYALQIFAPLQRHNGSEGRAYMSCSSKPSRTVLHVPSTSCTGHRIIVREMASGTTAHAYPVDTQRIRG